MVEYEACNCSPRIWPSTDCAAPKPVAWQVLYISILKNTMNVMRCDILQFLCCNKKLILQNFKNYAGIKPTKVGVVW